MSLLVLPTIGWGWLLRRPDTSTQYCAMGAQYAALPISHPRVYPLSDTCSVALMQGLQDPHAKVRWAACQALGQMCTDLGPNIQEEQHQNILPGLMAVMDDFGEPRVQVGIVRDDAGAARQGGWAGTPTLQQTTSMYMCCFQHCALSLRLHDSLFSALHS